MLMLVADAVGCDLERDPLNALPGPQRVAAARPCLVGCGCCRWRWVEERSAGSRLAGCGMQLLAGCATKAPGSTAAPCLHGADFPHGLLPAQRELTPKPGRW